MKTWLITDTHLGHAKMVEYCGRPENHSEIILKNLRKDIKDGDTLIHLGDICIGNDEAWHFDLIGYVPKGTNLILVRGNHDKKSDSWYLSHGWDFVCDSFSGHYFGEYITFSHIPIPNIQNINIHGHFHNNLHRMDEETKKGYNDNHKLLAIENTDYKPVELSAFLNKMK